MWSFFWRGQKFHRLLIDREHDAAVLAEDAVAGTGRIDDERTGLGLADFIHLFAREHEDVFVTGVFVEWNATTGLKAEQGSGRAGLTIAVEAIDIHALGEWFPRQLVLPAGDLEKVFEFKNPLGVICHELDLTGCNGRRKSALPEYSSNKRVAAATQFAATTLHAQHNGHYAGEAAPWMGASAGFGATTANFAHAAKSPAMMR